MSLLYEDESYQILGACFEVYKEKGSGFLEAVYQECLAIEFEEREISFLEQPELVLEYRARQLKQTYQPDFICFNKIIIEIKGGLLTVFPVYEPYIKHGGTQHELRYWSIV